MSIVQNLDATVEFLRKFQPEGPWVICTVSLDRKNIFGRSFQVSEEDALRAWLTEQGAKGNCYWHVNSLLRPVAVKAEKEDVGSLDWLHVDIDPRVGEELESEQARALRLLQEYNPPPTVIIFSGGGYQGFWKLQEPVALNGNRQLAEEYELYNKQLEVEFGGDHCHNVDRIMRLPGTVNRPDEKKRKKGRVEALAYVVEWHDDRVYPLTQFKKAVAVQPPVPGFTSSSVRVSGNVQRFASVADLPEGVTDFCKVVIVQGNDPDNPGRWPSRSEPLFYVCCELVRAGLTDDQIYAVITDPDFAISASVLDKGSRSERYALHNIGRARDEAIDPWLARFNQDYAVIGDIGGKCRVVTEYEQSVGESKRWRVSYQTFDDFANFWNNQKVMMVNAQGQTVAVPAGRWWLNHPQRRSYRTMVFSPEHEVQGAYNLWKGFAYDAKPGDCSLFLEHVRSNICAGDELVYDYVMKWAAQAVQKPAQPGHTAIVMRGRQGVGKGVFARTLGMLFGRHSVHIANPKHLVGDFNMHLRDCLLLFADEAIYAGDKKAESILKMLITEDTITIEGKGVNAESCSNFVHLIMASNNKWIVPAGLDERRFLVLDVGEDSIQNSTYFKAIKNQLLAGGYSGLLHHLLSIDLSTYNPRQLPKTNALLEQKMYSFSAEEEWWFSKLQNGEVLAGEGWPEHVVASALAFDFTTYARTWDARGRGNSTRLGRFLRSVFPADHEHRGQLWGNHMVKLESGEVREVERPRIFILPTVDICREHWDAKFGGPYDWTAPKQVQPKPEGPQPF